MTYETSVVGGTLINSQGRARLNVGITGGVIGYVGPEVPESRTTIDADGLVVLPGGVDSHVHLMDPSSTDREDFPTGTAAAARAGVTTIIEHTHAGPVRTVKDLTEKREYLDGRSNVDYALAAHAWPGYGEHVDPLWRAGIAFFKVFTCTTHGVPGHTPADLSRHLSATSDAGAPSLIHCEDESLTEDAQSVLRGEGREDFGILPEWRNRSAEIIATAVAATLVRRSRAAATIAHVSHPEVLDYIAAERERGADLAAEACPQYFLLREDEVHDHGALRKFTPPARARHRHDEDRMWELLRDGALTHVSSDHAPSTLQQKGCGSIWDVHFGLPGIDTTFPALIDAVARQQLAWEDVARVYAEMPARRYGLWPRKGAIRVGFDADLALVDPAGTWRLGNEDVVSKAGWSPYAGRTFTGRVVRTVLRGQTVAESGTAHDRRGGAWLPGAGAKGA
ncbi:dihydroorotase [Jiangella mangrovi]|uniref:Dihydroorotase (Multifunctional complex type) n=1 Tax=Jiangella mangrovi TaxID=1524084 RepID=A0A7W9GV01_9ACTN|nr:dihydroorotase (multifunctional complex type) [Jiangella mangrovi]